MDDETLAAEIALIKRDAASLPRPPRPQPPTFSKSTPVPVRLQRIQEFIYQVRLFLKSVLPHGVLEVVIDRIVLLLTSRCPQFEYNHTDANYFNVSKDRPYMSILSSAKEIIKEALPIKCMEAVMLALHLTNNVAGLVRIPMRFKSRIEGKTFRHIVLAVTGPAVDHKFGALGLSRKPTLEYKAPLFGYEWQRLC